MILVEPDSESPTDLAPDYPDEVGPYRIEGLIGKGGMGEVYRAFDQRLSRRVAIKHIRPAAARDKMVRERFRREAQAVAQLNHPAIVQVYDILETEDGDWIVMELVDGKQLSKLIKAKTIDLPTALRLTCEIADGLDEAHQKGIIHRDLKSENVLITTKGRAKILDFGLAKLLHPLDSQTPLSMDGMLLGTCRAMSPEQAKTQTLDPRSDIFSLGTLLYEAVTSVSPFVGATPIETLSRVVTAQHKPARELNEAISAELSAFIDQMLEKEPDDRPQNAEEVITTLNEIAGTMGDLSTGQLGWSMSHPSHGDLSAPSSPAVAPPSSQGRTPTATWTSGKLGSSSSEGTNTVVLKTLLMIDLVDSTRLVESLGDSGAFELLARHDRMARDLVARFDGLEIDKSDGFLLLFRRPVDAVRCALTYHRALARFAEQEGVKLQARAGIHLGELFLRENDPEDVARGAKSLEVEGLPKPVTARTTALARGGQTLMTQGAAELSRRALGTETIEGLPIRWKAHGRYRLRGVKEPVEIHEVGLEGRAPFSAPPKTTVPGRRRRGILALAALALVALAIFFILPLLSRPEDADAHRTSIAVLGFKNLSRQPDKEWLSTALAELFSTELAVDGTLRLIPRETVARLKLELGLAEADTLAEDTLARIRTAIGSDYVVLGSYIVLGEGDDGQLNLLPKLQSTRSGETVHSAQQTGRLSELFELVSRSGAMLREHLGVAALSPRESETVRATQSADSEATRLYSEGLDKLRHFDTLTARDLLLQAVERDPEYALAHAALSEAWAALGYDRNAVESAAEALRLAKDLPENEKLWIKGHFHEAAGELDKAVETYRMLWQKQPDNVDYGLQLAAVQTVAGQGQQALETLEALRRLPAPSGEDPRIDLAEAEAAWALSDIERQLRAADRAAQKGSELGARLMVAEALYQKGRGLRQPAQKRQVLEEARKLFAAAGDRKMVGRTLNQLGLDLQFRGKLREAEALMREALEIHEEMGDRQRISTMHNNLAVLLRTQGQLAEAAFLLNRTIDLAREVGARSTEAQALENLASVRLRRGELDEAEDHARKSLSMAEEFGLQSIAAWAAFDLGQIYLARGGLRVAREHYTQAQELERRIRYPRLAGFIQHDWGALSLAAGELAAAQDYLAQASTIQREENEAISLAQTARTEAALLLALERPAEAEAKVREALPILHEQGVVDDEISATAVLTAALIAQGRTADARQALTPLLAQAATSENPSARLAAAIAEARLLAAEGRHEVARARLETLESDARRLDLLHQALEAGLYGGEATLEAGAAETAQMKLEAVAAEARTLGLERIASQATALLAASRR